MERMCMRKELINPPNIKNDQPNTLQKEKGSLDLEKMWQFFWYLYPYPWRVLFLSLKSVHKWSLNLCSYSSLLQHPMDILIMFIASVWWAWLRKSKNETITTWRVFDHWQVYLQSVICVPEYYDCVEWPCSQFDHLMRGLGLYSSIVSWAAYYLTSYTRFLLDRGGKLSVVFIQTFSEIKLSRFGSWWWPANGIVLEFIRSLLVYFHLNLHYAFPLAKTIFALQ